MTILTQRLYFALATRWGAGHYPSWTLRPIFDIIFNAPFERKEDLVQTIDTITKIGAMGFDCGFLCNPLSLFNNTKLYEQAKRGTLGKIDFQKEQEITKLNYRQIAEHIDSRGNHLYLNSLLYWMRYEHSANMAGIIPRSFLPKLTNPKVVDFFESVNDKRTFRFAMSIINRIMPTRDRREFIAMQLRNMTNG